MKKRTSLKTVIAAASIAASIGSAQAAQPMVTSAPSTKIEEIKSTSVSKPKKAVTSTVKTVGGLDIVHENYAVFGLTPKEYGIRFGHGNKGRRSNMLRVSKRAKAKHRK